MGGPWDDDDERCWDDARDDRCCPTCGGEGFVEYMDCPEVWGEDSPSELNHLVTCPECGGDGERRD